MIRKLYLEILESKLMLSAIPFTSEQWEYISTNEGRITISSDNTLILDDFKGNNTYSQNQAILHLNEPLQIKSVLSGSFKSLRDEINTKDGIFASGDSINWTKTSFSTRVSGEFSLALPPNTAHIMFQQYDNWPSPYDGHEWANISIEAILPPIPQTIPYFQDFSFKPGSVDGWEYNSTNEGRIQVVGGKLRLDDSRGNNTYSQNEAILHVDLPPNKNVELKANKTSLKDETHSLDGIFISVDGLDWSKVSLPAILDSSISQIKFQQYDNYYAPYDGHELDNISIEVVVPPVPRVITLDKFYVQNFSEGKPGPKDGWEYNSTNDGRIEVISGYLRMDDSINGGSYSYNQAVLYVDMQGSFDAYLSGFYRSISDEAHDQDGIFVSSDGVTWKKLSVTVGNFDVLIPEGTTHIKFAQYDNYSANSDGREWGDLKLVLYDHTQPVDVWPDGLGFYKDIFVDGGSQLTSLRPPVITSQLGWTYDALLTGSGTTTRAWINGTSADTNGILLYPDGQPRYAMMYMNGGSSTDHSNVLGSIGRANIETFYAKGGSFAGSCAGLFFPTYYTGIWPAKLGNPKTTGSQNLDFSGVSNSHPFRQYLEPYTTVSNVAFAYGPVIRESYRHPDGTEFLGRITSGNNAGSTAVVAYKRSYKTGRMVGLPNHPESYGSGSKAALTAAVLQYARDGAKNIPDLKGTLEEFKPVTNTIGDKQYHRWTIDVEEGLDSLSLDLNSSNNVNFYVQYESFANSKSFLYESDKLVEIENPKAGKWHISVYGNDKVALNGVDYVMSLAMGKEVYV